jgi:AAA domain-containing protein/winged helix-turn-helix DNA-binding protein
LIANKPKKGKTVLNMNIALDIALGEPVLGHFAVPNPVDALYLALEESPRRMKRRIRQMLDPDVSAPVRLRICYHWPTIDAGAVEELDRFLEAHPAIGIVFIDTLTALLGPGAGSRKGYLAEYHALRPLFELARRRAIAIVVIYHTRKADAPAGDPLDAINATNGLSAAVDNCLILARVGGITQMARVGRDYDDEDETLALTRNAERLRWVYEGPADQVRMAQSQKAILAALEKSTTRLSPKELASVTGLPESTVRGTVRRMVDAGVLNPPTGRGLYGYPGRAYGADAVDPAKILDALRASPTRMTIKQLADAMQRPESAVLITVLKMVREEVLEEPNAQREYAYPGKQYNGDDGDAAASAGV